MTAEQMPVTFDACNRDDARQLVEAFFGEWARQPNWSATSVMGNALTLVFMERAAS